MGRRGDDEGDLLSSSPPMVYSPRFSSEAIRVPGIIHKPQGGHPRMVAYIPLGSRTSEPHQPERCAPKVTAPSLSPILVPVQEQDTEERRARRALRQKVQAAAEQLALEAAAEGFASPPSSSPSARGGHSRAATSVQMTAQPALPRNRSFLRRIGPEADEEEEVAPLLVLEQAAGSDYCYYGGAEQGLLSFGEGEQSAEFEEHPAGLDAFRSMALYNYHI